MATGVPETEVYAAADRVLARGERPTTERVRAELGRGSPARVGQLLEQWWDALSKRLAGESALPDLPPEVAAAFKTVWTCASEQARHGAEEALTEQRAQVAAALEGIDAQRRQCQADIANAEALMRQACHERDAAQARVSDLQRLLDQQAELVADALRQRDQLQARSEQLGSDLATMRAALQTQELTATAEREALNAHIRAVEDRAHIEIDRAREESKSLRSQLAHAERNRTALASGIEQERRTHRSALQEAERTAAASAARAEALEQQLARLGDLPKAWEATQKALESTAQRERLRAKPVRRPALPGKPVSPGKAGRPGRKRLPRG